MSVLDSSNFNQTCWLFVFFTYDLCGVFLSSVFCELFILYKAYTIYLTRKNCFRYLKLMSPLNKWYYLKKQLFDLEVKGQGPTKVITVRDTPSYGHAPTYQISLTYIWKGKKLWSGQASLRRSRRSGSGRKNQTKTICLPSFEGET